MTYCHFHTRRGERNTIIGRVAIIGSENSNMAFIFEIDEFLINYQYMMTYCHFHIRWCKKKTKIGTVAIFGSGNSNMIFIFEIDGYLINFNT